MTTEARAVAKGVTGQVETPLGVRLPFVITEAEPPRTWSWKVGGVTATGHEIESLGPSATRVEFTAPWAFFPYVVVLRIGLRRLKRLAESHQ